MNGINDKKLIHVYITSRVIKKQRWRIKLRNIPSLGDVGEKLYDNIKLLFIKVCAFLKMYYFPF